jgi:hypothetical protein
LEGHRLAFALALGLGIGINTGRCRALALSLSAGMTLILGAVVAPRGFLLALAGDALLVG